MKIWFIRMTIKTMNESTYSKNALENSSGVVSSSFTVKRYLNIQLVFCRHLFWQPNHHGCVSQSRRPSRSNISLKQYNGQKSFIIVMLKALYDVLGILNEMTFLIFLHEIHVSNSFFSIRNTFLRKELM